MPFYPQGLFYFNGIQSLLAASFTLAHGTTPSVATLYIPRQFTPLPRTGELIIQFGSDPAIVFFDCKVLQCDVTVSPQGEIRWALQVADTRWRWEGGIISGEYNVRNEDRTIREETIKTARELATMLFAAMGVFGVDVSQLPQDQFPEVLWETARPHQELQALLDRLGFTCCLGPYNFVKLHRAGIGAVLPINERTIDMQATFESLDLPEALVNVGGRVLYQQDLELEYVGLEPDGKVVKLEDMSYKPETGWDRFDLITGNNIKYPKDAKRKDKSKLRALATRCVFKMLRPKAPFKLWGEEIEDVRRILPLTSRQLLTALVLGKKEAKPAELYGEFNLGLSGQRNNLDPLTYAHDPARPDPPKAGQITGRLEEHPTERWPNGFSINEELGIIETSEPIFLVERLEEVIEAIPEAPHDPPLPRVSNQVRKVAKVYLRTSFYVREKETRGWRHFLRRLQLAGPGQGAQPRHVFHPDVVYKLWTIGPHAGKGVAPPEESADYEAKTNVEEAIKQADYYLASEASQIMGDSPATGTYMGFPLVFPDGAIRQITYSISDGGQPTTRISRNREERSATITYEERRHELRVVQLLEAAKKEERPRGPTK